MEIKELAERIGRVEDPRRTDRGNIRHKLEDIIIGLSTLICGGEDFPDMEEFEKEREEWLRTFLELPNGIPDSDTFRRVFERIAPEALSECLYDWLGCHCAEGSVIAIDGKTIRGSGTESRKAYHVVSAFVAGGADYVIGLKSNQPCLLEDVSLYFEHFSNELPCFVTRMKDHGRIEKREYRLLTDLSWLPQREEWAGLLQEAGTPVQIHGISSPP